MRTVAREEFDIPCLGCIAFHTACVIKDEEIVQLKRTIESYASGQVWYTNALEALRPMRYHVAELLDVVEMHNRFAKVAPGQVILSEKVIKAAQDAEIVADEFFASAGWSLP